MSSQDANDIQSDDWKFQLYLPPLAWLERTVYSALWRHLFDAGLSQAAPFTEKKGHAVADELSPRNAVIKQRC